MANSIYSTIKASYQKLVKNENLDPFIVHLAAEFILTCKDDELKDLKLGFELAKRCIENAAVPSAHYYRSMALAQSLANELDEAADSMEKAIELLPEESFWREEFESEKAALAN